MESESILEQQFWKNFVKSGDFQYLAKAFKDHKKYLDNMTIISVRDKNFNSAIKYQAKSEDIETLIKIIEDRINEMEVK